MIFIFRKSNINFENLSTKFLSMYGCEQFILIKYVSNSKTNKGTTNLNTLK